MLRKRKSFTSFLVFFFFFCSVKYIYVAILVYLSKLCVLYGVIYGRNPGRIKWKFFERMIILFSPRFRSFRFFFSSFHSKWQNVHFFCKSHCLFWLFLFSCWWSCFNLNRLFWVLVPCSTFRWPLMMAARTVRNGYYSIFLI